MHGKKGDRFLYVSWADRVGGFFHGFRRGKLMLDRIDPAVVAEAVEGGRTLVATVSLTDEKGGRGARGTTRRRSPGRSSEL